MPIRISKNHINNSINKKNQSLSFQGFRAKKYIYLCQNSPVSETFVKKMTEGIELTGKIGEKIRKKQNVEFPLAQIATDAFPHLKDSNVPGYSAGSTYDKSNAVALFAKNGNEFAALIGLFEKPKGNPPADKSAIAHELIGHQLDCMFYNLIGCRFTQTKGFTENYLKDIRKIPTTMKKHKKRIEKIKDVKYYLNFYIQGSTETRADDIGKAENFAEICAKSIFKSTSETYSKGMDKVIDILFPNTVAYTEKLLFLLGKKH